MPPTEEEEQVVDDLVAQIVAELTEIGERKRAAISRSYHKPRPPGHLTPDQLAAAYQRAGIKRGVAP